MSVLEDMGNAVKINLGCRAKIIPAVNIQVENVPGYLPNIDVPDGKPTWYGVYFEIMFEHAALWVVEYRSNEDDDDTVKIETYSWAGGLERLEWPEATYNFTSWDQFVESYEDYVGRN